MDNKVYGYARVSTKHQSISRQIDNLKKVDSSIIIFQEAFTGTKMDRPVWNKLMKIVKEGDTIVFDEVSRMSRDAEEGFEAYKDLYNRGISLQFIKESTLNTDNFRNASTKSIEINVSTGSKLITKKSIEAKKKIKEYSKDFDGSLSDGDVIKLVGISRNSYYKYKGEMLA
ncbi:MAG: recombinase family protein [Lachnospiraceae bacterium]|nr:recombinase family protein [Lachnospiraceae bacterium]